MSVYVGSDLLVSKPRLGRLLSELVQLLVCLLKLLELVLCEDRTKSALKKKKRIQGNYQTKVCLKCDVVVVQEEKVEVVTACDKDAGCPGNCKDEPWNPCRIQCRFPGRFDLLSDVHSNTTLESIIAHHKSMRSKTQC